MQITRTRIKYVSDARAYFAVLDAFLCLLENYMILISVCYKIRALNSRHLSKIANSGGERNLKGICTPINQNLNTCKVLIRF